MNKKRVHVFTVLFLTGLIGSVQAAGFNAREDCCTEGPPYQRNIKHEPAVHTVVVVDQDPLYIEGMGFEPRPKGPRTIVPKVAESRDWCCEGFTEEMHIKRVNRMEPAAGN